MYYKKSSISYRRQEAQKVPQEMYYKKSSISDRRQEDQKFHQEMYCGTVLERSTSTVVRTVPVLVPYLVLLTITG